MFYLAEGETEMPRASNLNQEGESSAISTWVLLFRTFSTESTLFGTRTRRETPIDFARLTGDVPEGFSEPSRLLK